MSKESVKLKNLPPPWDVYNGTTASILEFKVSGVQVFPDNGDHSFWLPPEKPASDFYDPAPPEAMGKGGEVA